MDVMERLWRALLHNLTYDPASTHPKGALARTIIARLEKLNGEKQADIIEALLTHLREMESEQPNPFSMSASVQCFDHVDALTTTIEVLQDDEVVGISRSESAGEIRGCRSDYFEISDA